MNRFPISPKAMISNGWSNSDLVLQLIKREVIGRYKGSVAGIAWSFLSPLLMLMIFTFVFGVVFKSKWGVAGDENQNFAVILFVGMIVNTIFSECLNRSPLLITSNPNYVKKLVFPLDVLPYVSIGSALVHGFFSVIVLIIIQYAINQNLPWTILIFPVLLAPLLLVILGLSWFLSALGVYFRDVSQVTPMISTAMMFFSPVFYPLSAIPEQYHRLVMLNPLTLPIEEGRQVLIYGLTPNFEQWSISLIAGLVFAYMGFFWFQKTRKGFADVI